jgi:hypothetical protein
LCDFIWGILGRWNFVPSFGDGVKSSQYKGFFEYRINKDHTYSAVFMSLILQIWRILLTRTNNVEILLKYSRQKPEMGAVSSVFMPIQKKGGPQAALVQKNRRDQKPTQMPLL